MKKHEILVGKVYTNGTKDHKSKEGRLVREVTRKVIDIKGNSVHFITLTGKKEPLEMFEKPPNHAISLLSSFAKWAKGIVE